MRNTSKHYPVLTQNPLEQGKPVAVNASSHSFSRGTSRLLRAHSHASSKGECVEEDCDDEQCGSENAPPSRKNEICGIDTRPFLPLLLVMSTLGGGACFLGFQVKVFRDTFPAVGFSMIIASSSVYLVTISCLFYCIFADPGQATEDEVESASLPKRSKRSWQYERPILRYDHYCRWVTNSIGLYNHRPFITLLVGLLIIGFGGAFVDVVLAIKMPHNILPLVVVTSHFLYSTALVVFVGPILRIHIGLISRNETAQELKKDIHYMVERNGKMVEVADVSDDDGMTDLEDQFVYSSDLNQFDQGWVRNCFAFWCTSRWAVDQRGEF